MTLTRKSVVAAISLIVIFAAASIIILNQKRPVDSSGPTLNPSLRSVVVFGQWTEDLMNRERVDVAHVELIDGSMPAQPDVGVVVNDLNCAADDQGISHCINHIRIAGKRIVVQHHHSMATIPCLTPGDLVNVVPS